MRVLVYQLLHLVGLLALVSSLTAIYLSDTRSKIANMVLGLSGLVMLISAFGMIHLQGYSIHSAWIAGKLAIWAIITIGAPIIAKRKPELKRPVFAVLIGLLVAAIALVIFKP